MRVPVLAVLPSSLALRDSATAFIVEGRQGAAPAADAAPPGLELDPNFPAIPLGPGTSETANLTADAMTPDASEAFVVRAFVEVDDPQHVPETVNGTPVFVDPPIEPVVTCSSSPAVGSAAMVATLLDVANLAARGLDGDGVAVAVMDTGINLTHLKSKLGVQPRFDAANSWVPQGVTATPGNHPVGHGTMCAYDVLIAAPKATLVDFAILRSTAPGGSQLGGTLGTALQAYAALVASWGVGFAAGSLSKYKALVVSNSWAMYHPSWDFPPGHRGRYCDNPSHPFNTMVGLLANSGVDIVFAAGNCGQQCASHKCKGRTQGSIMGASTLQSVLTLGGCDTADQWVGYSSEGPSITGMFQHKPDLAAYTHFLGSEASGAGTPDSGTSTACPVAAGCVAAIRTREASSSTPPMNLFAQLISTARPAPGQSAGWTASYGHGIIDPVAAAGSLGL